MVHFAAAVAIVAVIVVFNPRVVKLNPITVPLSFMFTAPPGLSRRSSGLTVAVLMSNCAMLHLSIQ